jgi:hypothetical protein
MPDHPPPPSFPESLSFGDDESSHYCITMRDLLAELAKFGLTVLPAPFTARMVMDHSWELSLPGSRAAIQAGAVLLEAIKVDADNAVEAGWISPMTEHVEGEIAAWLALPAVVAARAQ